MDDIEKVDPEVAEAIKLEIKSQEEGAEMIASENFVSKQYCKRLEQFLPINILKVTQPIGI